MKEENLTKKGRIHLEKCLDYSAMVMDASAADCHECNAFESKKLKAAIV